MIQFIKKISRSSKFAWQGLTHAYRSDQSFRMEISGGLFYVVYFFMVWPIPIMHALFVILSYMLILITELVNTAAELTWEKLHPGHDELVGKSKDVSSAAVFIAFVFAMIVAIAVAYMRFLE